jgi:dGTPase
VVDELEERYPLFDGLNLSFETREGILKHCSRANAQRLEDAEPGGVGRRFLDRTQPSLEAQLCNLADEIAYNAHDIDDGVRSGLLTLDQVSAVPLFGGTATRRWPTIRTCRAGGCCTKRSAACCRAQVYDVIAATRARSTHPAGSADAARSSRRWCSFSAPCARSRRSSSSSCCATCTGTAGDGNHRQAKEVVRELFAPTSPIRRRCRPASAAAPTRARTSPTTSPA